MFSIRIIPDFSCRQFIKDSQNCNLSLYKVFTIKKVLRLVIASKSIEGLLNLAFKMVSTKIPKGITGEHLHEYKYS